MSFNKFTDFFDYNHNLVLDHFRHPSRGVYWTMYLKILEFSLWSMGNIHQDLISFLDKISSNINER